MDYTENKSELTHEANGMLQGLPGILNGSEMHFIAQPILHRNGMLFGHELLLRFKEYPDPQALLKIVKQHQPTLFLVGLPLNMDDTESELSARARKFARRLRHQTNIETLMVDERLTTREARSELEQYQSQGRGKKLAADSIAAALFIESWYRSPEGLIP